MCWVQGDTKWNPGEPYLTLVLSYKHVISIVTYYITSWFNASTFASFSFRRYHLQLSPHPTPITLIVKSQPYKMKNSNIPSFISQNTNKVPPNHVMTQFWFSAIKNQAHFPSQSIKNRAAGRRFWELEVCAAKKTNPGLQCAVPPTQSLFCKFLFLFFFLSFLLLFLYGE